MRRLSLTITVLLVGALGALNCGSDKSPTRPGNPASPVLTGIEIVGPATIPPGGTAQFTIKSRWSDGTVSDGVTGATWRSSNTSVISIDSSGKAMAGERGASGVTASFEGRSSGKSVLVLPDGTFRLSGRVSDSTTSGIPVEGAIVEADSDSGRIAATTNPRGEFLLYGVRRDAVLRVSKDGYATHEENLQLTTHAGMNVALTLAGPRPQIGGTYLLSVGSPQCENAAPFSPLAGDLRHRTYTAVLTQHNERVTVRLTGRDFASAGGHTADTFSGVVTASGAAFDLIESDYYYRTEQDVIERLSNGTFLTIAGHAVTTLTDAGLTGTLNGTLLNLQTVPWGSIIGRCASGTLEFTLTR